MHKLKEQNVLAVARVMGEGCASAAALKKAAEHRAAGQEVEFYQHGSSIVVFSVPVGAKESK